MICLPQAASRSLSNSKMPPHSASCENRRRHGGQQLALGQNAQQVRGTKHGVGRQRVGLQQVLLGRLADLKFRAGLGVPLALQRDHGGRQGRIVDHGQPQFQPFQRPLDGLVLRVGLGLRAAGQQQKQAAREWRGESGEWRDGSSRMRQRRWCSALTWHGSRVSPASSPGHIQVRANRAARSMDRLPDRPLAGLQSDDLQGAAYDRERRFATVMTTDCDPSQKDTEL